MFWYVILMLFSPLYLTFGLVFRSEQARLILALSQQVDLAPKKWTPR